MTAELIQQARANLERKRELEREQLEVRFILGPLRSDCEKLLEHHGQLRGRIFKGRSLIHQLDLQGYQVKISLSSSNKIPSKSLRIRIAVEGVDECLVIERKNRGIIFSQDADWDYPFEEIKREPSLKDVQNHKEVVELLKQQHNLT